MQETFEGVESDMCSFQRMELATVLVTFSIPPGCSMLHCSFLKYVTSMHSSTHDFFTNCCYSRPVGWSESGGVLFQGSGTPKGRGSGRR